MKRSRFVFLGILFSFVLVLAGCGNTVDVGMNELTLKQLEEKLEDKETFVFLTFTGTAEHVEKTKLIEAYDDSLRRANLKGFYVNLEDENEQTISDLGERYTHPKMDRSWTPDEDGLMRAESGGVIGSVGSLKAEYIVTRANEMDETGIDYMNEYQMRNIDEMVVHILEKIEENKLELTY